MTRSTLQNTTALLAIYLFILLFVYAAVSKLLDFENFQVQLGQSPLLNAFAGYLSYAVIVVELIIAVMMGFKLSKLLGLYLFYTLMVLFTLYIGFVLTYSPFVPCSCGGVLEAMDWNTHLIFNIVFILLALVVLGYYETHKRKFLLKVVFIFLGCFVSIFILYRLSDAIIHKRNPFIRKFLPHHATYDKGIDLKYNSYYLAGYGNGHLYLGNSTAPRHVFQIDSLLKDTVTHQVTIDLAKHKFKRLRLNVVPPKFYMYDGQVPIVYQGDLKDWSADVWNTSAFFTMLKPADSTTVGIRGLDFEREMNVLGTLTDSIPQASFNPSILTKQIDGMFDTDGLLVYNQHLNSFVYVYYYRNQFIISDTSFRSFDKGTTIDTVSKARLKVVSLDSKGLNKLSSPAYVINEAAATWDDKLYIVSGTIGKYERKDMLRQASIVDVYDIKQKTYAYSFYVYHPKIRDFMVVDKQLFFIKENFLHRYELKSDY